MKNVNIPEGFIRSNFSKMDEVGVVLVSNDKVLRAIRQDHVDSTKELLETGLVDELVRRGLFPETRISDLMVEGYPIVLEHKKISPLVYPFEWSPEMLRRAALCVLAINRCANEFGYELKDAHPYNVLFSYGRAQYVDFGSIVKRKSPNGWVAYPEFINCYYRVLLLAERGLTNLFKHAFLASGRGFVSSEIMVAASPFYSLLGIRITRNLLKLADIYCMGPTISEAAMASRFPNPVMRSLVSRILKSGFLPFRNMSYSVLERKIKSLKVDGVSEWGDYHNRVGLYARDGNVNLSSRLEWVVNAVKDLSPTAIIELAGNQGILSRALSKLPGLKQVVCSDYDEKSIDQLLVRLDDTDKVHPACFDFMADIEGSLSAERAKRLKSDMVIALAVTHHLILTQQYSIDSIFTALASYTSKYVIVEFMPLGLWDGKTAPPLPDWYNETWFVENMTRYFKIIKRASLEDNRIAFVGEI